MKVIFATGNKGKLREVKNIFENTQFEIISLYDLDDVPDIIEDADTFEGNARIKAEAIYALHKMSVIADDSGLTIEQLNDEPGVYSARYAGENCTYDDNNNKVLKELKDFDPPHKSKFLCCAVYYDGKNYLSSLGELPGQITREFKGANGFGYDPIFKPEGFDISLAEMSVDEKNSISHRGRAFRALKEKMVELVK